MSKPGLILILLFALLIRIGWAMTQSSSPAAIDRLPDQREYLSLSQNLLHHGTICFFDTRFGQTVYAYRMPGYPLFVAACGGSVRIARLAQAGVDVSTVLAVFLIARKLCGQRAALFSAMLLAANPFYIFFTGLILSETLFAALTAWAIWFFISRKWSVGVLLLVVGCYVKPAGIVLVPLMAMAAMNWATSRPYRLWDLCRSGILATLVTVACLLPWAWRNHHVLGTWVFTTTNSGITLYDGFHPGADGSSDQRFIVRLPELMSMNEVDRSHYFDSRAKNWIANHAMQLPMLSLRKIARGWSPVPLSADFGRPMYRAISAAYSVPVDLLCLFGFFSPGLSGKIKLLLIMPAIGVTLTQVMSVGSIRYRMPAEAPLAVLAGAAATDLVARTKSQEAIRQNGSPCES